MRISECLCWIAVLFKHSETDTIINYFSMIEAISMMSLFLVSFNALFYVFSIFMISIFPQAHMLRSSYCSSRSWLYYSCTYVYNMLEMYGQKYIQWQ